MQKVHFHAGQGLGLLLLVKVNCNPTAYKDIIYNSVLPILWLYSLAEATVTYGSGGQVSTYFWTYSVCVKQGSSVKKNIVQVRTRCTFGFQA